jgi:hypothetical protein
VKSEVQLLAATGTPARDGIRLVGPTADDSDNRRRRSLAGEAAIREIIRVAMRVGDGPVAGGLSYHPWSCSAGTTLSRVSRFTMARHKLEPCA